MFCPECGKEIKEGSKFCKSCGNHIEGDINKDTPKSDTGETDNFFVCSDCGGKVKKGSSFCPHCKVLLTNTINTSNNVYDSHRCPSCGSDRITSMGVFKQKTKGYGCLLWIIIFLLCPLLFIIFFGVVGYSIYKIVTEYGFIFIILFIVFTVYYMNNYNNYVCERCGNRFRIKN